MAEMFPFDDEDEVKISFQRISRAANEDCRQYRQHIRRARLPWMQEQLPSIGIDLSFAATATATSQAEIKLDRVHRQFIRFVKRELEFSAESLVRVQRADRLAQHLMADCLRGGAVNGEVRLFAEASETVRQLGDGLFDDFALQLGSLYLAIRMACDREHPFSRDFLRMISSFNTVIPGLREAVFGL